MTQNGTCRQCDDNCTYKLEIVLFSLRDFPGWYKIVISYRRAIKKTAVHYVCPYATPDWQKNESIYCCFQAMLINFSRKSGPLRLAKKTRLPQWESTKPPRRRERNGKRIWKITFLPEKIRCTQSCANCASIVLREVQPSR